MEKRLVIGIAGSDGREVHDLRILPNTRVEDVLKQANLVGFHLAKADGGMYSRTDCLYDSIADGQKLYATKSDVEAGR